MADASVTRVVAAPQLTASLVEWMVLRAVPSAMAMMSSPGTEVMARWEPAATVAMEADQAPKLRRTLMAPASLRTWTWVPAEE